MNILTMNYQQIAIHVSIRACMEKLMLFIMLAFRGSIANYDGIFLEMTIKWRSLHAVAGTSQYKYNPLSCSRW